MRADSTICIYIGCNRYESLRPQKHRSSARTHGFIWVGLRRDDVFWITEQPPSAFKIDKSTLGIYRTSSRVYTRVFIKRYLCSFIYLFIYNTLFFLYSIIK